MPTYEFRCPDGHDFEKFYRSISGAEAQAACPVCGKPAERRMSAAGFAFKGSGFYLTDYGKNAHRGESPEQKATTSAAKDGSDSKGDSTAAEAKSDAPKSDAPKSADSSPSSGSESKKSESKPTESKPAPAPAKPSTGE
jgi:putative FmdB family regulatory protein